MHLLAEKIILEGLLELNLIKGDLNKLIELRIAYTFMPHGLGH